jgi:carboxylesterase type B
MAQVGDLWTDMFFKCPILERISVRYSSTTKPIYLYQWNVTPTCPRAAQYLGAAHSVDLMPTMGILKPVASECDVTEVRIPEIETAQSMSLNLSFSP